MTGAAFALVIASAFLHATWNFLMKRSRHKTAFLTSMAAISFTAFLVPATVVAVVDGLGWKALLFGLGSAGLHGLYGLSLSRGYQVGDLSAVYPISRGMGPALVPLAAVLVLGESVSPAGALGIGLVVLGIYATTIEARHARDLLAPVRGLSSPATRIALLTGVCIASYSVWDKAALDHLSPLTLNEFAMAGNALIVAPFALMSEPGSFREEWRERPRSLLAAGLLAPTGYLLVLVALETSRISYVAPAREVGIVFGAILGVVLLREGFGAWRIAGAVLIVAGLITLGVAS